MFIISNVPKCTIRSLFTKLNPVSTQNAQMLLMLQRSRRDEWSEVNQYLSTRQKNPSVDYLYSRSTGHLKYLLVIKLHKEIHFCSQNVSLLTTWISFNFWLLWPTYSSIIERYCQLWRLMISLIVKGDSTYKFQHNEGSIGMFSSNCRQNKKFSLSACY